MQEIPGAQHGVPLKGRPGGVLAVAHRGVPDVRRVAAWATNGTKQMAPATCPTKCVRPKPLPPLKLGASRWFLFDVHEHAWAYGSG